MGGELIKQTRELFKVDCKGCGASISITFDGRHTFAGADILHEGEAEAVDMLFCPACPRDAGGFTRCSYCGIPVLEWRVDVRCMATLSGWHTTAEREEALAVKDIIGEPQLFSGFIALREQMEADLIEAVTIDVNAIISDGGKDNGRR